MAVTAVFAGGSIQVYEACLRPLIEQGVHVVCDRFWFDDFVFRGPWVQEEVLRGLYQGVPKPDLAILLDLPEEVIWQRNQARQDGRSPLLASPESIAGLRQRFLRLAEQESMVIINGNRPVAAVSADICDVVSQTLLEHI